MRNLSMAHAIALVGGMVLMGRNHVAAMAIDPLSEDDKDFLKMVADPELTWQVAMTLQLYDHANGGMDFSPNCCDENGNTPLLIAARAGNSRRQRGLTTPRHSL